MILWAECCVGIGFTSFGFKVIIVRRVLVIVRVVITGMGVVVMIERAISGVMLVLGHLIMTMVVLMAKKVGARKDDESKRRAKQLQGGR